MPMERRGRVIRVIPTLVNRQREEPTGCDGERQLSMDGTSRVSREAQARICERLGVRFPGATRPRGATPRGYSTVHDVHTMRMTVNAPLRPWPRASSLFMRFYGVGT